MKHSPYPTSEPTHCSFYLNPPLNSISFFSAKPPPTAHILFPTPLVAPYKALKRSVTWHRLLVIVLNSTQGRNGFPTPIKIEVAFYLLEQKKKMSSCHSLPAESYMFSSSWLCALYSLKLVSGILWRLFSLWLQNNQRNVVSKLIKSYEFRLPSRCWKMPGGLLSVLLQITLFPWLMGEFSPLCLISSNGFCMLKHIVIS